MAQSVGQRLNVAVRRVRPDSRIPRAVILVRVVEAPSPCCRCSCRAGDVPGTACSAEALHQGQGYDAPPPSPVRDIRGWQRRSGTPRSVPCAPPLLLQLLRSFPLVGVLQAPQGSFDAPLSPILPRVPQAIEMAALGCRGGGRTVPTHATMMKKTQKRHLSSVRGPPVSMGEEIGRQLNPIDQPDLLGGRQCEPWAATAS